MDAARLTILGSPNTNYEAIAESLGQLIAGSGWQVVGWPSMLPSHQVSGIELWCAPRANQIVQASTGITMVLTQPAWEQAQADSVTQLIVYDLDRVVAEGDSSTAVGLPLYAIASQASKNQPAIDEAIVGVIGAYFGIKSPSSTAANQARSQMEAALEQAEIKTPGWSAKQEEITYTRVVDCLRQPSFGLDTLLTSPNIQTEEPTIRSLSAASTVAVGLGASVGGQRVVSVIDQDELPQILPLLQHAELAEIPQVVVLATSATAITPVPTLPGITLIAESDQIATAIADALNLAQQRQAPVIVLVNKANLLGWQTFNSSKPGWPDVDNGSWTDSSATDRYRSTTNGVSPRLEWPALAKWRIAAEQHDRVGQPTVDSHEIENQANKRARKLQSLPKYCLPYRLYGPKQADITLVSASSFSLAIRQSITIASQRGHTVNALQLLRLTPFPGEEVAEVLRGSGHLLCLEPFSQEWLGPLIRQHTGITIRHSSHLIGNQEAAAAQIVAAIKREFTHAN